MNEQVMAAAVALEKIKGDIVTGTLDALNSNAPSSSGKGKGDPVAQSYDFQKSVLSAAYSAKGVTVDSKS